jgi:hypothetical protein
MLRYLPVPIAVVILVASGAASGLWSGRWAPPADINEAKAVLARVPATCGDWESRPLDLDPEVWSGLDTSGYLVRRYVNRRARSEVTVVLECGWPGHVAVHTPDVCYPNAGYELVGERTRQPAPTGPGEFWVAHFRKPEAPARDELRIFWAWNADGAWQVPNNPRLAFGGRQVLYKLCVIRRVTQADEPLDGGPIMTFLNAFVPALQACLQSGPEQS